MIVILPRLFAYFAQAIARRMFGVNASKPMMSFLSIASRIAVSFTMRSSTSSTGIFSRSRLAPR